MAGLFFEHLINAIKRGEWCYRKTFIGIFSRWCVYVMAVSLDFNQLGNSYLPSWDILSEFLIHNATNRHEEGIARHFRSIVHPKVVLKILAERWKIKQSIYIHQVP